MRGALLHPGVQFAVAFGALLLGLLVSLWSDPIRNATRLAFLRVLGRVQGDVSLQPWVLAFWIAATLWATIAYLRLIADALDARQNIGRLEAAVYRAPNPSVVLHYARYIRPAAETLDRWQRIHDASGARQTSAEQARADQAAAAASCVTSILRIVATLASEFSLSADNDSYGASVMLVRPAPLGEPWRSRLSFGFGRYDLGTFGGVLETQSALGLPHLPWQPARNLLRLNLPFPEVVPGSPSQSFPGAPTALLTGQAVLLETTDALREACVRYDAHVRTSVAGCFARGGDGDGVRSQFSIRIGHEVDEPVGVLVIDASRPYLLGRESAYYESFLALLTPLLNLLVSPVATYASLCTGMDGAPHLSGEVWNSEEDVVFSKYIENEMEAETRNRSERNSTVSSGGGITIFGTQSPLQADYRSSANSKYVRPHQGSTPPQPEPIGLDIVQ
jgi:hypothetical protein